MSTEKPPKLVYPCAYPLKIVGEHTEDFVGIVFAIVRKHDAQVTEEHIAVKPSAKGRYASVNITITAQGPEHIQALFVDLKASGRVQIVI
jgi:putative lipoic acid-binding regulatory protein